MMGGRRWIVNMLATGGIAAMTFVACAKGTDIEGSGGSSSSASTGTTTSTTSGSGGGISSGEIGSACQTSDDCSKGECTQVGNGKYCTVPCPPECPAGTYCSIIAGESICIPDVDQLCTQCNVSIDCKMPSDQCLTAPDGDKFCAMDCTTLGTCPNGFTCMDADDYQNGMQGSGAGGGGGGGGAGGMMADAGPPKPSGVPYKFCVPNSGFSCPCNDKRDGVAHNCHVTNAFGDCVGTETCDGTTGKWNGCNAKTPEAETCNNVDDNCDQQIDEGNPNDLCSSEGPQPPHSTWACTTGACKRGPCDPGWTQFPLGTDPDGCQCPVDAGEPNGSCTKPTDAGSVTDKSAPITIQGTLSSASDVDVWTFNTTDTAETGTNSYHVSISITAPMPNDEFLMDVIRSSTCVDMPTGAGVGVTSYDWCVNGQSGAKGEAPCGNVVGQQHCGTHSSKYYLRVYRKPGAQQTCTPYVITVSGGGGTCDFTQMCQ